MISVLQKSSVLIADDHPVNLALMQYMLQQAGANVITASNGTEALIRLENNTQTGLVLLDVQMPGKNGKECAVAIRQDPSFNHILLVAISAENTETEKQECLKAGFDAYIVKPLSIPKLTAILDQLNGKETLEVPGTCTQSNLQLSYLAMVTMNDAEAAMEIITETTKTAPALITDIDNAISNKKYEVAAAHLHKLKGLIAIMEFEPLLGKIKNAEQKVKASNVEGLGDFYNNIEWQLMLDNSLKKSVAVIKNWPAQ